MRRTNDVCILHVHHLANLNSAGFAYVHGLIMMKEQVAFTHATVMRQQNKRECMMTQKSDERWQKNSLERYTHYYEKWATNQSSRQKALADLQQMQSIHLEKRSDKQG
ncbi:hypothetical protein LXL04_002108 [Taraxacum kok-saghyz]